MAYQIGIEFISTKTLKDKIKKHKAQSTKHKSHSRSESFNKILDCIENNYLNEDQVNLIKTLLTFEISISILDSSGELNQETATYLLQWMNALILERNPIPLTRLANIITKKSPKFYKNELDKYYRSKNSDIKSGLYNNFLNEINNLINSKGTSFKKTGDLLDTDIIHISIFGFLGKNKTLIFTGDNPEVIRNRIHNYLNPLLFLDFSWKCNIMNSPHY